jgi:uncharacterized membrane protein
MRTSRLSQLVDRLFACVPYVSLFGVATLVANLMFSFEEPHWAMLNVAVLLIIAAPLGVVVHLAATSELKPNEKRLWVEALASRKGPALFAAYFSASERARATHKLHVGPRNST